MKSNRIPPKMMAKTVTVALLPIPMIYMDMQQESMPHKWVQVLQVNHMKLRTQHLLSMYWF